MLSLPYRVVRSEVIESNKEFVFNTIANFYTWKEWSPWLILEPNCSVEVKNDPLKVGHYQKWIGDQIGSGEITLTEIRPKNKLTFDLKFLKPFKSQSKVWYQLEEIDSKIKVTWGMEASIPIFLFFLKTTLQGMIGSDFERGLKMLKEFIETGKVNTKLIFNNQTQVNGFNYLTKRNSCAIPEISSSMQNDMKILKNSVEKNITPDFIFSMYHKWDLNNKICDYEIGYGFTKNSDFSTPAGLTSGKIPSHQVISLTHAGPYHHLGNAWAALISVQKFKKIKLDKNIARYEIYMNDPTQVEEDEVKTEVRIPIRS
ncbi:MAG: SRPBCC family protein [Bdellovibrionales bacterium]|nr:SRPBCC family protein [Bdellovibrionales bacterium]